MVILGFDISSIPSRLWSCLFLALTIGCVESYHPPLSTEDVDIMVVNGFINASKNSATVQLSHANALSNANNPNPETGATVIITEENGASFSLEEKEPGNY